MEIVRLAWTNFKRYKKTYNLCILCISLSVFLIVLFQGLYHGAEYIIQNEINKNYTFKEVELQAGFFQDLRRSNEWTDFKSKDLKYFRSLSGIDSMKVDYRSNVELLGGQFGDIKLNLDEYIEGIDVAYDTFSKAQINANLAVDDKFKPIVAGRDFKKGDQKVALVDELCVVELGLENPKDIIGKKIKIKTKERVEEVKIVGVYALPLGNNENVDLEEAKEYQNDVCLPVGTEIEISLTSLIVSSDVIKGLNLGSPKLEPSMKGDLISIKFSVKEINDVFQVYDNIVNYTENYVHCEAQEINKVMDYLKLFSNFFTTLGMILLGISFFNLYCTMLIILKKRTSWLAVQNVLGFTKKEIVSSYILELGFSSLWGYAEGIITALLICKGIDGFVCLQYGNYMSRQSGIFYVSGELMIGIFVVIIVLTAAIDIIPLHKILKMDSIEILKEND